jgi:hypothetical protein
LIFEARKMRRIYLFVFVLYLGILNSYSQTTAQKTSSAGNDSTNYQSRKLHVDEVNIVSAYYQQDGNNSAVTGGIGTEKLTDIANTFDLQISKFNKWGKKNTFTFEIGVDHYTSASSDKIDPNSISSASMQDTRVYPSLNWTKSNEQTGNSYGFTGSYSYEYDYTSIGAAFNLTRLSKNKNTQFDFKLQAFLDQWTVILPVELRTFSPRGKDDDDDGPLSPRNSFNSSFSISQVINQQLQAMLIIEPSYQHGLLATKYQRSYFTNRTMKSENLPDNRFKLPIGVRLNYFLDDHFIIRTFYRYYQDDWGLSAHTAELEIPTKISPFFSVSPFYRYNKQSGTKYFAAYGQHNPTATYFTSDYDLSSLSSDFFGTGIRLTPPKGVFGVQRLNMIELRYGHYVRSTSLISDVVSLNFKFK